MNDYMTAIHEAGHAVVLASLGHAQDILFVTAMPNFIDPEIVAHYDRLERLGSTIPRPVGHSLGYVQRDPDRGPLPLSVEVPFSLGGVVAELKHAPEGAFSTVRIGFLNGDIASLVQAFEKAGIETSDADVFREVNRLLFQHTDLQASSAALGTSSLMFTALAGMEVSAVPRHECIEIGLALATEKIRTHWNVVRALADLLVEKDAVCSPDLLAFFERHGLLSA